MVATVCFWAGVAQLLLGTVIQYVPPVDSGTKTGPLVFIGLWFVAAAVAHYIF